MMNLCNLLSALRAPLALFFLREEPVFRLLAIALAMLTDVLDGYFARKFSCTSQFGAMLDPFMDRIFVVFALGVLVGESRIGFHEVTTMLCRDFALVVFGFYLCVSGNWGRCQLRALWAGKATTALQFIVLMAVVCQVPVPPQAYTLFVALGGLALLELIVLNRYSMIA